MLGENEDGNSTIWDIHQNISSMDEDGINMEMNMWIKIGTNMDG